MTDKKTNKELYEEAINAPGVEETLAFLNNDMNPEMSSVRGRAFYYRLHGWKDHPENIRM